MGLLGVERTARLGRAANPRRFRTALAERRRKLEYHLEELRRERAEAGRERLEVTELTDGWARDDSGTLPGIDSVIEEMNAVIEERGGRKWDFHGKPFLFDILPERAWETYRVHPRLHRDPRRAGAGGSPLRLRPLPLHRHPARRAADGVDHRLRPAGGGAVALEPALAHRLPLLPHGVRDPRHPRNRPGRRRRCHFVGETASRRAAEALRYNSRGADHRVSDEEFAELVEPSEWLTFTGPPGSVMFIDSSRCFHFGSRNPANPRYQLQYAYVSPVRNDFGDLVRPQASYPVDASAPLSRRLALNRGSTR